MPFLFRRPVQMIVAHIEPALPRTDEEVRMALRHQPHYRVVLHNDDVHDMDFVVLVLLRVVPQLTTERAVVVMMGAHLNGQAEVIVCPRETAEFFRESLEHHGLTSTIEPA